MRFPYFFIRIQKVSNKWWNLSFWRLFFMILMGSMMIFLINRTMWDIFLTTKTIIHILNIFVDIVEKWSCYTDRWISTDKCTQEHQCRKSYERIRTKEKHTKKYHNERHRCVERTSQAYLNRIFKNLPCCPLVMRLFSFIAWSYTVEDNNSIIDTIPESSENSCHKKRIYLELRKKQW